MAEDEAAPANKSQRALDWVNFFIADVETAFGPFIAVYLIANGWSQATIGLNKRLLLACAIAMIAAGALIFAFFSNPIMVFAAEILQGGTAGIVRPAPLAAVM